MDQPEKLTKAKGAALGIVVECPCTGIDRVGLQWEGRPQLLVRAMTCWCKIVCAVIRGLEHSDSWYLGAMTERGMAYHPLDVVPDSSTLVGYTCVPDRHFKDPFLLVQCVLAAPAVSGRSAVA